MTEVDAQALLDDQLSRWQRGERVVVEDYLTRHPHLDASTVLDLITNEVLVRQQSGETPLLQEYLHRFPHLAAELRVQFGPEPAPAVTFRAWVFGDGHLPAHGREVGVILPLAE